ncbi:flagellar basal body rod protein FlgB [Blastopirellula marina]|uniref:Flagellar basal body rod protein FlgB n=1 Tax=Blastopirellula marina TaxID=124 RepID=A0A2S8GRU9_9BACT|nr:flagellar basal body rod protein FlgB [Blastopirellula marina]PQO26271.1 flagellar basal body rod protein FlgB [Blastopirellula marina]PQO47150.1 flagellar basal body rod protein FlgB [Blastopirellula marina]PTL40671.1 flagellar basal body rod protein FlgB [Blastopirellula marina]
MSGSIFNASTIPVLEQVLNFSQSRHNLLAGNIANLDTPGYKVRDLNLGKFQAKLREAIEEKNKPNEPLSPGLVATRDSDPMRRVKESIPGILFHDESNVGIEQQVMEMTKNQIMHNMAITIMEQQMRLLQTAISERV